MTFPELWCLKLPILSFQVGSLDVFLSSSATQTILGRRTTIELKTYKVIEENEVPNHLNKIAIKCINFI